MKQDRLLYLVHQYIRYCCT